MAAIAGPDAKAETDDYGQTVLMSPQQGEALAGFALHSEKRMRPKPDCSHLVHLLYARAGLIYPYEDSRVLYRGVNDFQRVKTPQAGDLVVWLGHVGIVLSTEEETFISSVHSGILTESWKAPHWIRRGRPRFYRYRIGPETDMNLLSKIMADESGRQVEAQKSADRDINIPLPSSTGPSTTGSEPDNVRQEPSELSRLAAGSPDESSHGSASIIATITQHQTPSREQIAESITAGSRAHARRLIDGETLNVARPFTVFSRLEVEKIKVKHENGWVTLRLSETMSHEDGRILPARTTECELSMVRRKDGVWVISDPRERTYLAEEQALEVFEHQAELFLREAPNSSSTRIVVKSLNHLYDHQSDTPQRAAIK
ncbi:MAG TPA: NlpC/P60 family protein [Candidatus Angelobacter sp.]|nr:NlpC/P60 family protein [Candidatus Angelobacter sp.]